MANLTPKQDKFARKYIETGNASEAYRQSYSAGNMKPEAIAVEASRLLGSPKVALRVAELQQRHIERHMVTVDSLTKEYEEIQKLAMAEKQFSPAVAAVTGIAKLHGLLVDKAETKVTLESATDEQLDRIVADAAAQAGIGISLTGKGPAEAAE